MNSIVKHIEAGNTAAPTYPAEVEGALSPAQVTNQIVMIQSVMRANMREGEHYGKIPGTGKDAKPTLLKSGAEKLALLFRLAPEYDIKVIDLAKEGLGPPGHREVQITCRLTQISTGRYYGSGVGSCSTLESKYRYRNDTVYDAEGKPLEVPGKYWQSRNPELLGGVDCRPIKKEGKWVIVRRGEVVDIGDVYNTVLKIAKKRAYIDAILSATAASDIFTQDVEDFVPSEESKPRRVEEEAVAPAPERRETITGTVTGASTSQYKGKTYYCAQLGDDNLITGETELGLALVSAQGLEIEAVCAPRPNKGPHHYKVLSLTYLEPVTDAPSDELDHDDADAQEPEHHAAAAEPSSEQIESIPASKRRPRKTGERQTENSPEPPPAAEKAELVAKIKVKLETDRIPVAAFLDLMQRNRFLPKDIERPNLEDVESEGLTVALQVWDRDIKPRLASKPTTQA
jgi:hypothetical protein